MAIWWARWTKLEGAVGEDGQQRDPVSWAARLRAMIAAACRSRSRAMRSGRLAHWSNIAGIHATASASMTAGLSHGGALGMVLSR
jgi:hypothetical protein